MDLKTEKWEYFNMMTFEKILEKILEMLGFGLAGVIFFITICFKMTKYFFDDDSEDEE